ncbi:MAG: hypothetical protein UV94_C0040G0001 [Parcubacteria group bacterium GW2011_GWC1_43_30]|nr:MAG: hypothetical protein UV94_C0040G0001 [Parcubacteria group bacterium GW2011_GWC1_43_30]
MSKYSRSGGKYTGNHTTLIPAAQVACDIAYALAEVVKISPGFIKAGLKPVNGRRRVKFTDEGGNCIMLSVRDNASHQEVRVYVTDVQIARTAIARGARNAGIAVCFRKEI